MPHQFNPSASATIGGKPVCTLCGQVEIPLFACQCVGRKPDKAFCGATFSGHNQHEELRAHILAEHSDCEWMMNSLNELQPYELRETDLERE